MYIEEGMKSKVDKRIMDADEALELLTSIARGEVTETMVTATGKKETKEADINQRIKAIDSLMKRFDVVASLDRIRAKTEHIREKTKLLKGASVSEEQRVVIIVFNTKEKIPEMDKYMASKLLAEFTALGGTTDTTAITSANILATFDTYMEQMDDAEVPEEGRVLYLTPALRKLLKEATGITREINVDMPRTRSLNQIVSRLDEVEIITVPSVRMKSAYDFTSGAVSAVGAKQIRMILLHPSVVIVPFLFSDLQNDLVLRLTEEDMKSIV